MRKLLDKIYGSSNVLDVAIASVRTTRKLAQRLNTLMEDNLSVPPDAIDKLIVMHEQGHLHGKVKRRKNGRASRTRK